MDAINKMLTHNTTPSDESSEDYVKSLQMLWMEKSPFPYGEIKQKIPALLVSGNIISMKCEKLHGHRFLWEVELAVEWKETGIFIQFLIFNQEQQRVYFPFDVPGQIETGMKNLIEKCIAAPHMKLNNNNRGMIFDRNLIEDINNNFDEYFWERMYPGTVFATLNHFLTHMGRYQYVKQFLGKGDVVIDAACGIGYGTRYLSDHCSRVYGVDLSSDSLSLARRYYHHENIKWMKEDVTALPMADHSIDCFVSMETFEHIASPERLLTEIRRVLKKGGSGYISTPNGKSPRRKKINNPYHVKEYSHEEMNRMCGRIFDDVSIYGMRPDFNVVKITNKDEPYDNLLVTVR